MKENYEIHWKDYYTILQVSPTAEVEVIKAVYSKLAMKYHPDHNNGTTEQKMKDLTEAFEILGNPIKRREYDTVYRLKVNQAQTTTPAPIYKTRTQYTPERRANKRRKRTMTADELSNLMKQKSKPQPKTTTEKKQHKTRHYTKTDDTGVTILLIFFASLLLFGSWVPYVRTQIGWWLILSIPLSTILIPCIIVWGKMWWKSE